MKATASMPLWLATIDERGGTLWQASLAPLQRLRLERVAAVENAWEEHQHGRPSPLGAKNGHTYAAPPREDATMAERFAKDVGRWLEEVVDRHAIERLHLYASERWLATLRRARSSALDGRVEEHAANLARLDAAALARHPAVVEVVKGTP